jgi:hypothetical protein
VSRCLAGSAALKVTVRGTSRRQMQVRDSRQDVCSGHDVPMALF